MEVCDLLDLRDVQTVAEHATKITSFLLADEKKHLLPDSFMQNQKFINEQTRAYLVDWLMELHCKFQMRAETLYVAVGLLDRYIAATANISKEEFECLGVTVLHIAGKYEEIYPPDLKTILRVTNSICSHRAVVEMEFKVLQTLEFQVQLPSANRFIERFARLA